jgi:hypothetical protein
MPKNRKPLTPSEQFNNLCEALAEDALTDKHTPRKQEAEVSHRDDENAWTQKEKKKRTTKKAGGGAKSPAS